MTIDTVKGLAANSHTSMASRAKHGVGMLWDCFFAPVPKALSGNRLRCRDHRVIEARWYSGQAKEMHSVLTLNRILLASDFSTSAEAAMQYAAAMARQSQARLLVMHVVETGMRALPHWTDVFRASEVLAAQEVAARRALDGLLAHAALAGLEAAPIIVYGEPVDHITDMAARVDLVVMGSGIDGGHIARAVAHSSAAPVLLIPPGGGAGHVPTNGAARVSLGGILLALDVTQYAAQAIEVSTALADDNQVPLQVVQVLDPRYLGAYPVNAGVGMHHNLDGFKVLLEKRLAEVVPDDPDGPPIIRRVVNGEATEVLSEQIAAQQSELVVMSAHEYGGLRRFFSTSTIDALLAQGLCPLLVVPLPRLIGG